jgi:hypothetical protein
VTANAPAMPILVPLTIRIRPRCTTIQVTAAGVAPEASRMPISREYGAFASHTRYRRSIASGTQRTALLLGLVNCSERPPSQTTSSTPRLAASRESRMQSPG